VGYSVSARGALAPARLAVLGCLGLVGRPLTGQQIQPSPLIIALPASPRFAGLGGASVAVNGDASSVFSNPTGLATIKHVAVEGAVLGFADGSLEAMGAGAVRIAQFDVGGGARYLKYRDTASVRDNVVGTGSVVFRRGLIAIGASGKYVSLVDTTGALAASLTSDFGLQFAFFDIMSVAAAVQNVGNSHVSGGGLDLPTSGHLGLLLNFVDPQETFRLMATVEEVWTNGESPRTLVGLEGGVVLHGLGLVVRGGLGAGAQGSGIEEEAFGASLIVGRVKLDYSYQHRSSYGGNEQGLGLRLTL